MQNFEFDGEKYKQSSKHQKEWGNRLISELKIKGNEAILDLGCGDGVLTEELSMLVPHGKVIGIDASIGMINTAKKLERNNLIFICMDINDMDFVNQFDLVFSNAALHWVKNHQQLLQNSFASLKPNGMLVWNFAGDGNCAAFFDTVKKVMNMPSYQEFFSSFDWPWFMPKKEDYVVLVEKTGFKQFDVSYENADRYFSRDEMIKWIDQPSIVPFLNCIPENKKKSFRNTVVEIMIDKTTQADGSCFETFRRINIKAMK